MLKLFRHKGILVKILLWVIVLGVGGMMALTLIPGTGGNPYLNDAQGHLAVVGDRAVTQFEANRMVNQQMRSQFGGTENEIIRNLLMEQTIENLITTKAVIYEAERLGFQASLPELVEQLQANPTFYPEGKFIGRDAYENLIRQLMSMTAAEFEQSWMDQQVLEKLNQWVTGGIEPTPPEVEQEFRLRNEKVKLEYVLFRSGEYQQRIRPTEEDLRAYYEANRESFQLPERRAARYVEINNAILNARVQVSEDAIERLYQERRSGYLEPEAVRVRRILFSSIGDEQKAEDRKTAEEVLKQLHAGADFGKLAETYSAHAASSANGGELGWIVRGQTVPEVEAKLFGLKPGSPAELVDVPYGIDVIQVLERRPERVRPLSEVRAELVEFLKQQSVQDRALDDARDIVAAVRAGQSLEQAAQAVGWRVSELPLLDQTQSLPMFGQDSSVLDAVFRLPLDPSGRPTGAVSDPVAVESGYVIVQLKEVSPLHTAEFDEIQLDLLNRYRTEKAAEMMREQAQALAGAARQSGLATAAGRAGLRTVTSDSVTRNASLPEVGRVSTFAATVFALKEGEISDAVSVGGNWVVFRVVQHQTPDPQELQSQRAVLEEGLREQKRQLAWSTYTTNVRSRLEQESVVQLNQVAIDAMLRRR